MAASSHCITSSPQERFPEGNSHHTLLRSRLKAMYIAKALIAEKLSDIESMPVPSLPKHKEYNAEELLSHLNLLHTTDLGAQRVQKNLHLNTGDVVAWCKVQTLTPNALITRTGKN